MGEVKNKDNNENSMTNSNVQSLTQLRITEAKAKASISIPEFILMVQSLKNTSRDEFIRKLRLSIIPEILRKHRIAYVVVGHEVQDKKIKIGNKKINGKLMYYEMNLYKAHRVMPDGTFRVSYTFRKPLYKLKLLSLIDDKNRVIMPVYKYVVEEVE